MALSKISHRITQEIFRYFRCTKNYVGKTILFVVQLFPECMSKEERYEANRMG